MVFHDRRRGQSAEDKLQGFRQRLHEIYEEQGQKERFSKIFISMLCDPTKPHSDWVSLKAKGAETRHFIPVLKQFAVEQAKLDPNNEIRKHQIKGLSAACCFYDTCDSQDMFMTPAAARFCKAQMEQLLEEYTWLNQACSESDYYCNIVPKCHYCWHLADSAKYLNPRHAWTYKCESWVGKVSTIAAACAYGTRASAMTVSHAAKYRIMVSVNLWRVAYEE
jgi:hypothetical protein